MNQNAPFSWPDEAVATLRRLWADGKSCSQIAAEIGVTRNAIIGKVHRLKLPGRSKDTFKAAQARRAKVAAAGVKASRPKGNRNAHNPKVASILARAKMPALRAPTLKRAPVPEDDIGNDVTHLVGIMDLKAHQCRWIEGDPLAVHGYCGEKTKADSSYCPKHYARVYLGRAA